MIWILRHLKLSKRFLTLSSFFFFLNSCFFILFWLDVYFFLLVQILIWVPIYFLPLFVPCTFSFISLCIAFTSFSVLHPYSIISMSILDCHVYFLHQIREVFLHYFFQISYQFLSLPFSFWHPYDSDVGVLKLSQRFLSLSSFFFFLILVPSFCSSWMFISSFCSKSLI